MNAFIIARLRLCLAVLAVALVGCTPEERPNSSDADDDDDTEDSLEEAGVPGSGTSTEGQASHSNEAGLDAGSVSTEAGVGVIPADASDGVVIGTIDPDEVSVVEVEAGRPQAAVCSEAVRDVEIVDTLAEGSIPLGVTPDGTKWAYARLVSPALDASTSVPDMDAGVASSSSPAPQFEIRVEGPDTDVGLIVPDDQDPNRGAALDPTGNSIVTTLADTRGFVLWELDTENDTFELAEPQPFVRLNALAQNGGVRFEKPVFSASGERLYARELGAVPAIVQLVLRDSQWETELRITQTVLDDEGFSLTAASADDLTLFGRSGADEHPIAWWRTRPDEPFHTSLALGEAAPLAVSADCRNWWSLE